MVARKKRPAEKSDKAQLRKKMKIEMLKYCLVWCFNETQTIEYFKARNEELSHTHYYELKKEFNSDEATKGWFTEQAISAMEVTHKQSVEQLDELIKATMTEVQQLQATPVYIQVKKKGQKEAELRFNPSHNSIALFKGIDSFTNLIKQRDDMLAATPVVQAIMSKHAETMAKSMVVR